MYSGITSGRVLNGELLYTKILEVNLYIYIHLKVVDDSVLSTPAVIRKHNNPTY